MFSEISRLQDTAGFSIDRSATAANASDLSIPMFNIAGAGSTIQSSTASSSSGSGTSESTTTVNGKTTSVRVANNLIQIKSDFTSDGTSDLVQINRVDGVAQLFVNQSTPIGTAIALPAVPANWEFSGLADGDGNGVPDLYWTDKASGQSTVWLSTGNTAPPFYYRTEATGSPGVTMPTIQSSSAGIESRIQSRIQSIFGRVFGR
jgi:hypothetical protein